MHKPMSSAGRRRWFAPVALILLSACGVAVRPGAPPMLACGIDHLGTTLVRPATVECGTVGFGERSSGVSESAIFAARRCVRQGLDRGQSIRVAISRYGVDTAGCEVAIRDDDGEIWHLVLGSSAATGRAQWALTASRCLSLTWSDDEAEFRLSGCVDDAARASPETSLFGAH